MTPELGTFSVKRDKADVLISGAENKDNFDASSGTILKPRSW